jgi:cell division septal protein FtsQ
MASRSGRARFRPRRRTLIVTAACVAAVAAVVFAPGLFTVTAVRFYGGGSVPKDSLETVRIGLIGKNLVTLSTGWARERLTACSEVESVAFKRRFLHTFECHVRIREPVAILCAGTVFEVDREGVVIPRRAGRGDIDLPVITGISERALRQERGRNSLARAVEVLGLIGAEGFSPAKELSEIHVDGEDIDLVWMGSGTLIRLGRDNYMSRVRKLRAVSSVLLDRERLPLLIDLRFDRQVIIR